MDFPIRDSNMFKFGHVNPALLMRFAQFGWAISFCLLSQFSLAALQVVRPGEIWSDDRGLHIQAHGGGILRFDDMYYWFGEDRSRDNDPDKRYIACYSSKDLVNWTFRNQVIAMSSPGDFGPKWVLERPKVFYNANTKRFVMYMHVDGQASPSSGSYTVARVGVAVCDTVDGDYRFLTTFRPLGHESRDLGQFIDDDGSAYLIFEDRRAKGFHIAALSDDYLTVERDVCLVKAPIEGGAIVHLGDLYYAIGSELTGWRPNPNKYAIAKKLSGPWSEFRNIAPPSTNTYGCQSTMLLKIIGTKTTTAILMADRWNPAAQWDSRYVWMPLQIDGERLVFPEPRPWTLDVATGECELVNLDSSHVDEDKKKE
jgi:Glycosyl hydrolases family 43